MLIKTAIIATAFVALVGGTTIGLARSVPAEGRSFGERVASSAATLMMKGIAAGYSAKIGGQQTAEAGTGPKLLQVNFRVEGDIQEFSDQMDYFAPFLSQVPGMTWKVWSVNEQTRQANGTYLFQSQADIDLYLSEIMPQGMEGNPR
ncbi:MAG: YdhR family protein, partial [Pseudomonadota bacterium]